MQQPELTPEIIVFPHERHWPAWRAIVAPTHYCWEIWVGDEVKMQADRWYPTPAAAETAARRKWAEQNMPEPKPKQEVLDL